MQQHIVWEGDTASGHYQVVDGLYDGREARVLYSGERQAAQSGVPRDDGPDLLFDYNQRLLELALGVDPKAVLIIGGGAGTLANALLETLPDVRIDMVEPDDGLTKLAYDFFDLPVDERLHIFCTDGRMFLREHAQRYQMVIMDAFVHTTIPAELKTLQAFQAYRAHLRAGGILAMNVISGYHGSGARPLQQVYAAALRVFDTVDVLLASRGYSLWLPQNFILAAQRSGKLPVQQYVRLGSIQPPEVHPGMAPGDGPG